MASSLNSWSLCVWYQRVKQIYTVLPFVINASAKYDIHTFQLWNLYSFFGIQWSITFYLHCVTYKMRRLITRTL